MTSSLPDLLAFQIIFCDWLIPYTISTELPQLKVEHSLKLRREIHAPLSIVHSYLTIPMQLLLLMLTLFLWLSLTFHFSLSSYDYNTKNQPKRLIFYILQFFQLLIEQFLGYLWISLAFGSFHELTNQ